MKEYQKIESIYRFDQNVKGFVKEYYNPIVEYLENNKWIGTEKIDGTNIRIYWNGKIFEFGGRTEQAEIPKALLKPSFKNLPFLIVKPIGCPVDIS